MLRLLQLLDLPPREVAGLQHLALLLQTVNEWLCLVGSQGRAMQRTLIQVQEKYFLNERFVSWVHAAIRQAAVSYSTLNEASVRTLREVCRVARLADRWAGQLEPALGPTLSNLGTCESDVHCGGVVFAMG